MIQQTAYHPEARHYPRYPVYLLGSLLKDDYADHHVLGESDIFDLSIKGCQICSEVDLDCGKFVALRFSLPNYETPVQIDMASIRWTNGGQCGLEFIIMTYKDETLLSQYVRSLNTSFH